MNLVHYLLVIFILVSKVSCRPTLLDYGLDHRDTLLPRDNDDISSQPFRLQVPVVYFGQKHTSAFINQNGLVSFGTPISNFLNMPFPLDYSSIAPFYADVDTRIEGSIYYRESQQEEFLQSIETILFENFGSANLFRPTSLLIATWDSVGYYDRKSDKTNTYQLVIASDGEDSYALFLYDKIEWIQGTGKNPSQPDAKAQAGFISGIGPYYTLRGSGTDQMSNLHKRSNTNTVGLWAFRIGKTRDSIEEPDLVVGLDEVAETGASCSIGATECHSQAQCIDYSPGYCCQCITGFFGNGRVCLQETIPQRVTGKVKGVLNGIAIDEADLFAYVLPGDGRAYTAIARIPERLGYDIQTLPIFGTIIGWLFSTRIKGAPNGFQLTGGLFNYTAEVQFTQTGQKVTISQIYEGLDVFSHLKVDTRLFGNTAVVPLGKAIEINDYEMQITRVSPGLLRSQSNHNYRVEGTSVDNPISIEQTITYDECSAASPVPPELETTKMKVGRNYIQYDAEQEIARYAITSKVVPIDGEDPCKENKDSCGPNSSCVANDDSFKCICNLGYEENYDQEGSVECVDIDECRIGSSTCDVTAVCINIAGSYRCECRQPYSGDGYTCTKILSCEDVRCGPNAECIEISVGAPECRCVAGFYGDGIYCVQQTGREVEIGTAPDCRNVSLCDPNASCEFGYSSNSFICTCNPGFHGDGIRCAREVSVGGARPLPSCLGDYCHCPVGFLYNPFTRECEVDDEPPEEPIEGGPSYLGNTCDANPSLCDPNAACVQRSNNVFECVCRQGFSGDGHRCTPESACRSHEECGPYGQCAIDASGYAYYCKCREGFEGSGGTDCRPSADAGCDVVRNCDSNADCRPNYEGKYVCQCRAGFQGDGTSCQEDMLSCRVLNNCSPNGNCEFDERARGYRCSCKEGFTGNGLVCRTEESCYTDRGICDSNADCTPNQQTREWSCVCRPGFLGDGQICRRVLPREEIFLLAAKGMAVVKVPGNGDTPIPLSVNANQTAIAIDTDCANEKFYWSDVAGRVIRYGFFNGSVSRAVFLDEDIGSPEGLAVDSASQLLYWTDSSKDTIEVAHLVTKQRKVLIDTGLVNPRGIAIYARRGRLFWSDWNRDNPKIEFAGLDGLQRQVFIGDGLSLPNSLIIDEQSDQICWADAGIHRIECAGIDGQNRQVVTARPFHPFGLAFDSNTFYWTDWNTTSIETASRTGLIGKSLPVIFGGPGKLYGLALVPATCPQAYSPCAYSSCRENQICLPNIRGGRSCRCTNSTTTTTTTTTTLSPSSGAATAFGLHLETYTQQVFVPDCVDSF